MIIIFLFSIIISLIISMIILYKKTKNNKLDFDYIINILSDKNNLLKIINKNSTQTNINSIISNDELNKQYIEYYEKNKIIDKKIYDIKNNIDDLKYKSKILKDDINKINNTNYNLQVRIDNYKKKYLKK